MGVWLKGNFLEANKDGEIMIPYSDRNESSVPIILVYDNFSELS